MLRVLAEVVVLVVVVVVVMLGLCCSRRFCWAASLACFSWFSKWALTSSAVFRLLPVLEGSPPCDFSLSNLSAKALISHSSSSSSGTHVSTATGPVGLVGSCFLGLRALERRPFLCGVGVSLGVSLFPRGQMIFLMQYSERMP